MTQRTSKSKMLERFAAKPHKVLKVYFLALSLLSVLLILIWNGDFIFTLYSVNLSSVSLHALPDAFDTVAVHVTHRKTLGRDGTKKEIGCVPQYYENETWQQDPEPPCQCVVTPGRLGNVMFGYASSLGVAAMANRTMVVDLGNDLLPHFKIKAVVDCDNTLCRSPKKKSQGVCCIFRPNLLEPEVDQPVLRVGTFLQSWRFFAHVEADLRGQFTAYGSTAKRAADTMRGLHREFDTAEGAATLVGVHVRHGDIMGAHLQSFGFQTPSQGYFRRAMMWYMTRFPRVVFIISSNVEEYVANKILPLCGGDLETARSGRSNNSAQNLKSVAESQADANYEDRKTEQWKQRGDRKKDEVHTGSAHDDIMLQNRPNTSAQEAEDLPAQSMQRREKANLISRKRRTRKEHSEDVPVPGARCRYAGSTDRAVDLVVLGSCDHFIMSVGTFGWWAGWLTRGTVVYYKYPAKEGSKLRKNMNYDDFFPPHWIPME